MLSLEVANPYFSDDSSFFYLVPAKDMIRIFKPNGTDGGDKVVLEGAEAIIGPDPWDGAMAEFTYANGLLSGFEGDGMVKFRVEGIEFGAMVDITLKFYKEDFVHPVASDTVRMRVAPLILLPGSASYDKAYAPDYVGKTPDQDDEIDDLGDVGGIVDVSWSSPYYRDPWLQDEVEIGYTSWPGGHIWVALDLPRNRGLDSWPENDLLGPGFGHLDWNPTSPERNDYGGNIEATSPVTYDGEYCPFGIVVLGSSCSLRPFIEAQDVQPVLTCDTEWLHVEHIDEVVSFLGPSSVLIADTDEGVESLEQFVNDDTQDNGRATGGDYDYVEDTTKNWTPNEWDDGYVEIRSGASYAEVRQIVSNDATKIYVYEQNKGEEWDVSPATGTWDYTLVARSEYRAVFFEGEEDFGIATDVIGQTMYDQTNTKNWAQNQWAGGYVMIFDGLQGQDEPLVSQTMRIQSSGSDSFTIAADDWEHDPTRGWRYVLVQTSKMDGAHWDWYDDNSQWLKPACTTVRRLWAEQAAYNTDDPSSQDDISDDIRNVRNTLTDTYGGPFSASDFTKIPALFYYLDDQWGEGAIALIHGMVNLLNKDGTLYMSRPFGPRDDDGNDVFEQQAGGTNGTVMRKPLSRHRLRATCCLGLSG